jgi:hypothetical protein
LSDLRKDSLTAEDGLCEFSSNSLISLAVRLFLWMFTKRRKKGVKSFHGYMCSVNFNERMKRGEKLLKLCNDS